MNKNTQLKVLNVLLAVVFLSQTVTGIFGELLGIPDEVFEIVHEKGGYVLAGLAVLHIMMNWKWVVSQFKKKPVPSKTSIIPKPDIRD